MVDGFVDEGFDFENARPNSVKNLLEAKKDDDRSLVKPDYVAWNMGFEPDKAGE